MTLINKHLIPLSDYSNILRLPKEEIWNNISSFELSLDEPQKYLEAYFLMKRF